MTGSKKTIWDLTLEIVGSDKGASAALKQVRMQIQNVQAAGKQLGTDFKAFTQKATKLALGVVGGVTAAGAATIGLANSFADVGNRVAKTSAAIGIGIEAYQGLSYAMSQSGLSAGEFDGALQKFNQTVKLGAAGNDAAKKQLEAIGLSAKKLAGMKPEEAMMRLSDYMQSLPDDAARTRATIILFGKSAGPQMMAAMKQGSAGLQEMMKEAKSLGIVLTEEQAHQSELYKSAQTRLMESFTGMKNQFIGGAIGPLTEAFNHLKNALIEQMPAIQELGKNFGQWLGETVKRLPEIIAKIKDFGTWIKDTAIKVSNFVGGWKNVGKILAGLAIAPTLLSGMKVAWSFGDLIKKTMKSIPDILENLGLVGIKTFGGLVSAALPIIGIIAGIAAAIFLVVKVVKNWERITAWISEHKDALALVGIAVGTLTAAIVAYTAAQAIVNAGGIVAVARMGTQAIAQGALTAVTAAHTIASWAATTATAAFGAAVAFLTSLITLVILAIGALIAASYLIVKNWKKISEFFSGLWENIKNIFSGIGSWFSDKFNAAKDAVVKAFTGVIDWVKTNWQSIVAFLINPFAGVFKFLYDNFEGFRNVINNVLNFVKNIFSGVMAKLPEPVTNAINGIKNFFQSGFDIIKSIISVFSEFFKNVFNDPVNAVKNLIGGLGDIFSGVFNSIKEKVQAFVSFFADKFGVVKDIIGGVGKFFGGIGSAVSGLFGGGKENMNAQIPGHASGGIFTHRHIAEIAEKGAEAVVPLNRSAQGFDIWKQAGILGGYLQKIVSKNDDGGAGPQDTPPVMAAAANKMTGGDNVIHIEFKMENNFNGGTPDRDAINEIAAAGQKAADDFEARVKEAMANILRDQRRVSFA